MSDISQGPGWWQAADGNWYPPHLHPSAQLASTPDPQASKKRSRTALGRGVALGAVSVLIAVALAGAAFAVISNRTSQSSRSVRASSGTSSVSGKPLTDPEVVSEFGDAVYRVEVDGCDIIGSGTAFAVDEHHLVTAGHVAVLDSQPTLVSRSGEQFGGTVIGRSSNPDVAVIEVDRTLSPVLTWADPATLTEGQHLLGLGYPVPATAFSAQPGSIVSFDSEGSPRKVVRTNAPLDHGDSGGPALTDRGEVVGVITELADNSDGVQTVPLLFTEDALGNVVTQMIENPQTIESDCSAADVLPPAPADLPPLTPATLPPVTLPPLPTYTLPPLPTTTTLPCPTGSPSVTVTGITATQDSPGFDYWTVNVTGKIVNNASASVSLSTIDVSINSSPPTQTIGFGNNYSLRPGETTSWSAQDFIESASQPTSATAQLSGWQWDDYQFYGCGTG